MRLKAFFSRLFKLFPPVFFLSSLVTDWRSEGWPWLAVLLVLSIASLWDFLRPLSPKAGQVVGILLLVLFAAGGWRHFSQSSPAGKNNAVATSLSATPDHGARGQTLTVTIGSTSVNFNAASRPNLGPDVEVLANQLINPTTLQVEIKIAPEAPLGRRRIWVSTPGGPTTIDDTPAGLFQVGAAGSSDR